MTEAQLLATGPELLGHGVRGVEPVLQELIETAHRELQIVAYVLTPSAMKLLAPAQVAAERGVKVTIIVNRFENQKPGVKTWLRKACRSSPAFRALDFSPRDRKELHAKLCIADRNRAVLGSANYSWGGLVSNYEIGILLEGTMAWQLADMVDEIETLCRSIS